jgi:RNA recognition motif-containing protein
MNIYVGNLPYIAQESDIREIFEEYGEVHSVKLISDRETGRLKGFGFVDMDQKGGHKAIEELDGAEFGDRNLKVNEARERTEKRSFNNRRPY